MSDIPFIRLSELANQVGNAIQVAFANRHFWVKTEITDYSFYPQKNYHFFEVAEKSENGTQILAKMQAVAWSAGHTNIRNFEHITGQQFKKNIQVLIKVSVNFHSTYGLKLTLLEIDVSFTIGALEKQKQETLLRLLTECSDSVSKVGDRYITSNNKLNLSPVIQNIAVLTSSQSAGLHDFSHTIEANTFGYKFSIDHYFTVVQGETNALMVYNKLLEVFKSEKRYDAVVIIRGGGAPTDFLIFDQFILGKIVAKFPIPIITGIGHQKNETIVDLMAHTATKTPTKAAEFILAHNRSFEEKVLTLQKAIIIKSQSIFLTNFQLLSQKNSVIVNTARNTLSKSKDGLIGFNQIVTNKSREFLHHYRIALNNISFQIISKPKILISNNQSNLANTVSNLRAFNTHYFKLKRGYLGHFVTMFKMISPESILMKGFAIVKINGRVTSDPSFIKVGEEMTVILSNKEIKSTVKSKTDYNGNEFNI